MGFLANFLPPWANPAILAIVGTSLVAGAGGAYIDHKFMTGAVAIAHLETAKVQADYKAYEGSVAANAARATAIALDQQNRLQGRVDALQAELLRQQGLTNAKSKALQALLASGKPGDARAIGPLAGAYYDRLRGP